MCGWVGGWVGVGHASTRMNGVTTKLAAASEAGVGELATLVHLLAAKQQAP